MAKTQTGPLGPSERAPTVLEGCAATRAALKGVSLVVLTATVGEAAPLIAALSEARRFEVAGKTVVRGRLGRTLPVVVAVGGCDKANTAHILTCLLQALDPSPKLIMQVGIAGAFVDIHDVHPLPGDIVLATEEIYADSGSSSPDGWLSADDLGLQDGAGARRGSAIRFSLDPDLVGTAIRAVAATSGFASTSVRPTGPRVFGGRCLTASRATGLAAEAAVLYERWGALAESMEGAAAAHICGLYQVPFLEVRGISNLITDRDRASWQVEGAVSTAGRAALAICAALEDHLMGATARVAAEEGERAE